MGVKIAIGIVCKIADEISEGDISIRQYACIYLSDFERDLNGARRCILLYKSIQKA
jgi:hypothetical protein